MGSTKLTVRSGKSRRGGEALKPVSSDRGLTGFSALTNGIPVQERLQLAYRQLDAIFETAANGMRIIDRDFNTIRTNRAFSQMIGIDSEEMVGRKCYETFDGILCHVDSCPLKRILSGEQRVEGEVEKTTPEGIQFICQITATPLLGLNDEFVGIIEDFHDITRFREIEHQLQATNQELEKKHGALEEKNIVLSGVLKQIEEEKQQMVAKWQSTTTRTVLPILADLASQIGPTYEKHIDLIWRNLTDIVTQFSNNLPTAFLSLTPREAQVCNMIKDGLASKEIAAILNTSFRTVLKQRQNIRRKLGITSKKISLSTYLKTI